MSNCKESKALSYLCPKRIVLLGAMPPLDKIVMLVIIISPPTYFTPYYIIIITHDLWFDKFDAKEKNKH